MGIVVKVAKIVAKYGKKAVQWVWNNTGWVLEMAAKGYTAYEIAALVGQMF